jgi:hypothetical protein
MAQFPVISIPLHTLQTPIREILAWIVVLTGMFANPYISHRDKQEVQVFSSFDK